MSDISQGTVYATVEDFIGTTVMRAGDRQKRGANIYTLSDLLSISGTTKGGEIVNGQIQQNLFTLSLDERVQVYRKCGPVYGVVTGRARRIANLDWRVKKLSRDEDRIATYIKQAAEMYREHADPHSVADAVIRVQAWKYIRRYLPDVKFDLSNVQASLLRWRQRNKLAAEDKTNEIEDWMHQINGQRTWSEFVFEGVVDLHVHGAIAWYKERNLATGFIENIYNLPGGTVLPFRTKFVSPVSLYAQILNGVPPMIYGKDEISYIPYAPMSSLSYGSVPLEALVNKIAESLLFDEQAAMKADGTSAPEKLVIMNDMFPFGDGDEGKDLPVALPASEQAKIETLINEPRPNAIRLLTGYGGGQGQPQVVDLSRADTFEAQSNRQDKVLREIAIVFNMSNIEVNLTGSENTSGRETSETQADIEQQKGWAPLAALYEDRFNTDVLPQRWGSGYEVESDKGASEKDQLELERLKMASGAYATNEVRTDGGREPWPEPEYDRPPSAGAAAQPPDGSEMNPLSVRMGR